MAYQMPAKPGKRCGNSRGLDPYLLSTFGNMEIPQIIKRSTYERWKRERQRMPTNSIIVIG